MFRAKWGTDRSCSEGEERGTSCPKGKSVTEVVLKGRGTWQKVLKGKGEELGRSRNCKGESNCGLLWVKLRGLQKAFAKAEQVAKEQKL